MNNKDRIFGLDVMRAIAIIFVLFAHTAFLLPLSARQQNSLLLFFGFIGVEIFFILSGYLIGKILIILYSSHPLNFKTTFYFWIRRWFRTLPNYYLALLATTTTFYFSNKVFVFSEPSYFLYLIFSQNLYSAHPDFFILAWSLSVEEWFYLLMPLWFILMKFVFQKNKKYLPIATLSFIFLNLLIRILAVIYNELDWDSDIRRVVVFRLDTIMIGVLAAYLHLNYNEKWLQVRRLALYVGILFTTVLSFIHFKFILSGNEKANFFHETVFFTLLSASISFFLPVVSVWKIYKNSFLTKAIIYISRISYSLYLFHIVIIFLVLTSLNKILVNGNLIKFAVCWIACFLFAGIIYFTFELPMMNKRDKYKL